MFSDGIQIIIGCNVDGREKYTFDGVLDAAIEVLGVEALSAYPVQGVYKEQKELSVVIAVYGDKQTQARLRYGVPALCALLKQECILCDSSAFGLEYLTAQDVDKVALN